MRPGILSGGMFRSLIGSERGEKSMHAGVLSTVRLIFAEPDRM